MVKFLLKRPIAVIMVFLGLVIIGSITFIGLPVSLLPDIAIPEITIQVTGKNTSARELENTVVKPIRRQLMQVGKLRKINSETRDGAAIIRLKFDYGTNTDLAFIEVNEKIDASMNNLPRSIQRPRVIKASATDIPVFYLNLTLKDEQKYSATSDYKFLNLSVFAENTVKRRIEQLPEVAMADITGLMHKHISITPNMNYLKAANIRLSDIENILKSNNIEPGSMIVRDGYYEYNIKFSSILRTLSDIENIYFRKANRIFQLKDIAKIRIEKEPETGLSTINGKRAITIGVIKQADETMQNLKESLQKTLENLEAAYPDIEFTINRNQTELLDYTIGNLKSNLSLGFLLVFIVALLFLGDAKSPVIIGMGMLSSLIISFVFFYLFKQSLNIISLSGMILALGMMIDSSIIVTDIITQYREKGFSLAQSCIKGTNEVITPILSSTFTTIAVFMPLVFLSGIAGAIFFDQAFAVSVGLLVSYFTGIILLPVLYHSVYGATRFKESQLLKKTQQAADGFIFRFYEKGFNLIFKHKTLSFVILLLTIPLSILIFKLIPTSNMPYIDHKETIAKIEWNENIHVDENKIRVDKLLQKIEEETTENAAYIGHRQYLLDKENDLSASEAQIYLRSKNSRLIYNVQNKITDYLHKNYPAAVISFAPPENIFEKIFDTDEPDIISELYKRNKQEIPKVENIRQLQANIDNVCNQKSEGIAFDKQFVISVNKELLLRYGVDYSELHKILKTAFKDNEIATLRSYQEYLPIALSDNSKTIEEILQKTLVNSSSSKPEKRIQLPISELISMSKGEDLKTIVAGKNGEYIPLAYYNVKDAENLINTTKKLMSNNNEWEVQFSGSYFASKQMLNELLIVLLISILLMYFILAAQFESFKQPLIVLAELPVDISFAMLILWLMGHTLNLMSAIGIVVTSGIIINDSILKIDMINELRKQGVELMEAIHTAGKKRIRAIVMTSLTTIFAMVPLLFSYDMGSELQKPLAVAMIATMLIGTLVSIFMIPLVYWIIYRRRGKSEVATKTLRSLRKT